MKRLILLIATCLVCMLVRGQSGIPQWFMEEMERQVGVWVASNEAYMQEGEDDSYAIEWKWGVGRKSLVGVLYGIRDSVRTQEYWQFFQYWDFEKAQPVFIQIASWGSHGVGNIERLEDSNFQLKQKFYHPDGTSTLGGHKTQLFDGYEISTSYDITDEGEWQKRRTYTWYKQK